MKNVLKYSLIFIGTIIILVSLLVIVSKIPKYSITENIKESLPYLTQGREINYIKKKHPFMWLHIYADEMLLNIIYNVDSEEPLKSVMKANYFSIGFFSLDKQVKNQEIQPNKEYIRYWHGAMIFVRSLLTVFNLQQIYILNAIILSILVIILIYTLWKKKVRFLIPIFIIAFIMTGSAFVPFCLEYYWNYLIMLVVTILALSIDNNNNNKLYILFFISGILTCFFDFLTTEEITILVPLVFIIASRMKKEQIKDIKSEIKFILISMIIWFIGYSFTWFAKWILASIILNINALDYVVDKAMIRINGDLMGMTYPEIYLKTLKNNIFSLYPLNIVKNKSMLLMIAVILILGLIVFRKNEKNYKKIIPYLIISIIPYIRYAILVNHSYRHYFFTFRLQFPVIMSIILIYYFCVDKNKLRREIKIRKKKRRKAMQQEIELTILIPCLNEEKTIGICINKAKTFLEKNNIEGEVLVIDNGSTDKSNNIARELGARVEYIEEKGYGIALINGNKLAKGKYTIMADADDSYNLLEILPIYQKLKEGYDLVIGNRYKGKMEKEAMKVTHKYIGTPIISLIGRKIYKVDIGDFNCGLRGYDTEKMIKINCKSTGMEYATEMIIKAKQNNLKITEIPINFYKDKRQSKSHLNTLQDGIRHFKALIKNE